MKRKALGKGLAALLPDTASPGDGGQLAQVALELIDANPNQPRQHIDAQKLEELAHSMTQQGVVQPLVVRRTGARFQIIAGERRWRAAQKAGLATLPVLVRDVSDAEALEVALVENIQREELNPIEEASAYRRLISELGYSQEQVATRVGKDRSTVANLLRLLRLPREIRLLIAEQKLSPGHARPLLALASPDTQVAIARDIADRGLSVRDVERRVSAASKATSGTGERGRSPDANTRDAEKRLEQALGTKVRIVRKGKRGRVEIDFHTEDQLQRLYDGLLVAARSARTGRGSKG
ncbi:MAG TPA: ParB/RepB/Spo0J family partition protein [Vicinamibacteria bacterium]|nr:ParB/RepB/Spo0J family partition protein [Vicinamibacteria bacterium]